MNTKGPTEASFTVFTVSLALCLGLQVSLTPSRYQKCFLYELKVLF